MLVVLYISNAIFIAVAINLLLRHHDAVIMVTYGLLGHQVEKTLRQAATEAVDAEKQFVHAQIQFTEYWTGDDGTYAFEPTKSWLKQFEWRSKIANRKFHAIRRTLGRYHMTAPTALGYHPRAFLNLKPGAVSYEA